MRDAVGIKTIGWPYGQTGIVATIRFDRTHNGRATQHFLPAGPFAVLPLPNNQASLVWTEEKSVADQLLAADEETFRTELEARLGGSYGRITEIGPRASWPIEMHISRRLTGDRLVLIGDAAHGVHPLAGQGFNLALRDIAALADVLSDTQRLGLELGSAEPLARYQQWRRADVVQSAMAYDALNRLFSNDNQLLRAARTFGLRLVDRLPALKTRFITEAAGMSGNLPRLLRTPTTRLHKI